MKLQISSGPLIAVLAFTWCLFAGFYISKNAYDALILWTVLPLLYMPVVIIAAKTHYSILFLATAILTMTNAMTPAYFFYNKDMYESFGWLSVGQFNFEVWEYLKINVYLLYFTAAMVVFSLLINWLILRTPTAVALINSVPAREQVPSPALQSPVAASKVPAANHEKVFFFGLSLVCLVLVLALLNSWMFEQGIALTGLTEQQVRLPYRMSGILYYFTRFFVPVLVFLLYWKSRRSLPLAILLMAYAGYAGFSQVSRTTVVVLLWPVIYFAFKDRRYYRLACCALLSIFLVSWVGIARDFIYLVVNGTATMDYVGSLPSLIKKVVTESENIDPVSVFFGLLNRVGGAQDIVLGYQFDTSNVGGLWLNFKRVFIKESVIDGNLIQAELFGFLPPQGFSAGAGGFSSRVLQIAGPHFLTLTLLAFWVGLLISFGDFLFCKYVRVFKKPEFATIFAFGFVTTFLALGQISWFYAFLIIAVAVLTKDFVLLKAQTYLRSARTANHTK